MIVSRNSNYVEFGFRKNYFLCAPLTINSSSPFELHDQSKSKEKEEHNDMSSASIVALMSSQWAIPILSLHE